MAELLLPTINFVGLLSLLAYFVWPLFKGHVAQRSEAIKTLIEEARTQKVEAERKLWELETKLREFESEVKHTLEQAQRDGEKIKEKIIHEAKEAAELTLIEADSLGHANLAEFKDELRRLVISKAVEAAENLVRDELAKSKEEQRRLMHEYVEKVGPQ